MTIKQIENQIAAQVKKQTGAEVEFTLRGENAWTISGDKAEDVQAAVTFMVCQLGWVCTEVDYDAECEMAFAYLTEPAGV